MARLKKVHHDVEVETLKKIQASENDQEILELYFSIEYHPMELDSKVYQAKQRSGMTWGVLRHIFTKGIKDEE